MENAIGNLILPNLILPGIRAAGLLGGAALFAS